MTEKQKLRKVKHLMHKYPLNWINKSDKDLILKLYSENKDRPNKIKGWWTRITELIELYKLIDELSLTEEEYYPIWNLISVERHKNMYEYTKRPPSEGRDNKDIRVGSGGSHGKTIRYPSKKRSIRTWKKFYNLFPYHAIEDKWDGKTSTKMK